VNNYLGSSNGVESDLWCAALDMLEWVLALCGSAAAPDALLAQTGIAEGVIAFVLAIQVLHKF
jgi:hypothetical protein